MNYRIKLIKYFLAFLLVFFGCVVSCELHTLDVIENISIKPNICFENNRNNKSLVLDISEFAESNNVIIYIVDMNYDDYNSLKKYIYCNPKNQDLIKKSLNITNSHYKSLFYSNDIFIEFNPLLDNQRIGNDTHFYLLGEQDNINHLYKELKKQFSITSANINIKEDKIFKIIFFIIWALVFIFLFSLSNYDVNCYSKEAYIKISFGEKSSKIVTNQILFDITAYFLIYVIIKILVNTFTSWASALYWVLLILSIISIIPYFRLSAFDISLLRKDNFSSKTLKYNMVFAFVSAFFSIMSMMYTLKITEIYGNYKYMNDFINYFDGYSLCDFQYYKRDSIRDVYQTRKKDEILNELIYRNYDEKLEPVILHNYTDKIIYANLNAYDYLSINIKELKKSDKKSDISILVPSSMNKAEKEKKINEAIEVIHITEGVSLDFSYEIIDYYDDVKLVTVQDIDSKGYDFFNVTENPVVIYNSIIPHSLPDYTLEETSRAGYMDDIMYRMDSGTLNNIVSEFSIENEIYSITDLNEHYIYFFKYIKRITFIMYFLVGIILLIEFIICSVIVVLNYRINSLELALKKVFGYSLIEKNKEILIYSVLSVFGATVINLILLKNAEIIFIGLILIIFVLLISMLQIYKTERNNTALVIKRK